MPYCTSKTRPEQPGLVQFDHNVTYINSTIGTWLRYNIEDQTIEVWRNGEFQASYNTMGTKEIDGEMYISANKVDAFIQLSHDIGRNQMKQDMRILLGIN